MNEERLKQMHSILLAICATEQDEYTAGLISAALEINQRMLDQERDEAD